MDITKTSTSTMGLPAFLAAAFLALALPCVADAQEATRPPAASAARSTPPPARTRTAAEQRDAATAPGEVRPVDPVVPQISVPLGRTAATAESPAATRRHDQAAASGGIDDSVARCKAGKTKALRQACLDRLGKAGPVP